MPVAEKTAPYLPLAALQTLLYVLHKLVHLRRESRGVKVTLMIRIPLHVLSYHNILTVLHVKFYRVKALVKRVVSYVITAL